MGKVVNIRRKKRYEERQQAKLKEKSEALIKFHDILMLEFLECMELHKGKQNESVADKFEEQNNKWIQFCRINKLNHKANPIFKDSVDRMLKKFEEVGQLGGVEKKNENPDANLAIV